MTIKKLEFLQQVRNLDHNYPLRRYVDTARRLLHDDARTDAADMVIEPPYTVHLDPLHDPPIRTSGGADGDVVDIPWDAVEVEGLRVAAASVFVLVAGGLGERLLGDYVGPPITKLGILTDTVSGMSFLHMYCRTLVVFQNAIHTDTGTRVKIPLYIMTSDDTHALINNLLRSNSYYGLEADQVVCIRQQGVPALSTKDCAIALDPENPYKILTKPHGHGDVHRLLYRLGCFNLWRDKSYVVFFQDTNSLTMKFIVPVLGYGALHRKRVLFAATPRKPGEAIGALCRTHSPSTQVYHTVNIEYSEICKYITQETVTGDQYSMLPGNMNVFCIDVPTYVRLLEQTHGIIAEFINPKYTDATNTTFKKPTRVECMMQDFSKYLPESCGTHDIVACLLPPWYSYNPVKNSHRDALVKQAAGLTTDSAISAEFAYYRWFRLALSFQTPTVHSHNLCPEPTVSVAGILVPHGPRIVLDPFLSPTLTHVANAIGSRLRCTTLQDSVFIYGRFVTVQSLCVSGFLYVCVDDSLHVCIHNFTETTPPAQCTVLDSSHLTSLSCTSFHDAAIRGSFVPAICPEGFPMYCITVQALTEDEVRGNSATNPFVLDDATKLRFLQYSMCCTPI
uniref:UTP-monosaccharide-1-phosphate uridylyltransferase n=3 Tax=Lygus hesperus TaxID=30085 RepID=A0A146L7H3_LYGHE